MRMEDFDITLKAVIKSNLVGFGIESSSVQVITDHLYQDIIDLIEPPLFFPEGNKNEI